MAKIKHTKNEMKAQKIALTRFERFLPMLQLKKRQLQAEIQRITAEIDAKQAEGEAIRGQFNQWTTLFSEPNDIEKLVVLEKVDTEDGNIAGVNIPIFKDAVLRTEEYDLFSTPSWIDDGVDTVRGLTRIRVEREILKVQRDLISEELRTTSQRVNLFEKVKIPECRENIRIIKIFLGDEQTAAVVRGKTAKSRTVSYEYDDAKA